MMPDPLLAALQADRSRNRDWLHVSSRLPVSEILELPPLPRKPARPLTICGLIMAAVARFYGVSVNDLKSDRRTANVVRPRHVAMHLVKHLTGKSLPTIGRLFGDRDHTTVLHAVRRIEARLAAGDVLLLEQITMIRAEVTASIRDSATAKSKQEA